MSQELILKIKKAEEAAAERLLDAKKQAKHAVEAGDTEGRYRAAEILDNAAKEETALFNDAHKRAAFECDKIAKQAAQDADIVYNKASAKLDRAVQIIISKVVG